MEELHVSIQLEKLSNCRTLSRILLVLVHTPNKTLNTGSLIAGLASNKWQCTRSGGDNHNISRASELENVSVLLREW